jgi:ABC-type antimicrobial peptide transport system permease subunit
VSTLLYGITTTDPITFVSVSALLIVVGFVASFLPAFRASRVDPLVALRQG